MTAFKFKLLISFRGPAKQRIMWVTDYPKKAYRIES